MKKVTLFLLVTFFSLSLFAQVNYLDESQSDTEKRLQWFDDAKYGMFIHFGLYILNPNSFSGKIFSHDL